MLGNAIGCYLDGGGNAPAVVEAVRAYASARGGHVATARDIESWDRAEIGFLLQDLCTDLGHAHDAAGTDHRAFVAGILGVGQDGLVPAFHPGGPAPGLDVEDLGDSACRATAFASPDVPLRMLLRGALDLCAEAGEDGTACILAGLATWEVERLSDRPVPATYAAAA